MFPVVYLQQYDKDNAATYSSSESSDEESDSAQNVPTTSTGAINYNCAGCDLNVQRKKKYLLQGESKSGFRQFLETNRKQLLLKRKKIFSPRLVRESDFACKACYMSFRREPQKKKSDIITLSTPRAARSNHACIFKCNPARSLTTVSKAVRERVMVEHRIYIPEGSKCCFSHVEADCEWETLRSKACFQYSAKNVENMVDLLINQIKRISADIVNFDDIDEMSEETVMSVTGYGVTRFNEIYDNLKLLHIRRPKTAIAIYLMKLTTGQSNQKIAERFQVSRATAESMMNSVRETMIADFVPLYLGANALNRQNLSDNCSKIARDIFLHDSNDSIITVWDGTYVYIQKSSNYAFQRKSFSAHKGRPLWKPMLCVTTKGKILFAHGPYEANVSDGKILRDIFHNFSEVNTYFKSGDYFIVDRGFRDAVKSFEQKQFNIRIPELCAKNQKQLTWQAANKSRFVTKVRFVVEVVNGHLKSKFKLFRNVWANKSLEHSMDDFKIACALYNAFSLSIESDCGNEDFIVSRMHALCNKENKLFSLVDQQNINQKSAMFARMSSNSFADFPNLSEDDIFRIVLGKYQIKQAISYIREHFNDNGNIEIHVARFGETLHVTSFNIICEEPELLRAKIRSRHRNSVKYFVYVLYDKSQSGIDSIVEYYCQCKNGQRTVGCCVHVASIIWYLAFGRSLNSIPNPAHHLDNFFIVLSDSEDDE